MPLFPVVATARAVHVCDLAPRIGRMSDSELRALGRELGLDGLTALPMDARALTFRLGYEIAAKMTDEGRARAREADMPLTTEALQHAVMNRLSGPQRRVLQPVIAAWPDELSVEELADAAGYVAGGRAFNNTRDSLRSLGLIDYPAPGMVVARPVLFVDGDG